MSKKLLFLWIFLLPTQLGRFFWPDWSWFAGIKVDYLSPVLYAHDLVAIGLIITNYSILKNQLNRKKLGLILVFAGINIIVATRPEVAFFRWLTIFKLGIVGWLVYENQSFAKKTLLGCIPLWLATLLFLDLAQVAGGSSLQGMFYWLGERKFSYSTNGIALMGVVEEIYVRAYGTFSHPNVQAGFVGACLLFWQYRNDRKLGFWLTWWAGTVVMVLTGSRLSTLVFFTLAVAFSSMGKLKKVVLGMGLAGILSLSVGWLGWDSEGVDKRIWLAKEAVVEIKKSPLFGVGLGNNILGLGSGVTFSGTRWIQPVHNLFLLIVAEIGMLGTAFLLYWSKNIKFNKVLLFVLLTGMVDHHWITGVQTSGLLAVILGLAYDKKNPV